MGQRIEKGSMSRITRFWRKTLKPFWRVYEVPIFIVFGLSAIILGFTGYIAYFQLTGVHRPILDIVFMTLQLFRMMFFMTGPFPWQLEAARWLAVIVIMYAAFRVVTSIFYDQVQLLLLRWFASDHVVICGLGQTGDILSETFSEQGYRAVVIEKNMTKEMTRKCRDRGITVVNGSAIDPQILRIAGVEKAKYLIVALGDDGSDVDVALLARRLVDEKGEKSRALTCYVQVADRQLCNLLQANYEFDKERWTNFRLDFFNVFDQGARALLRECPPPDTGHTVIVGMGRFGESLLLQMATGWLSAHQGLETRIRVSVVDRGAVARVASLSARYPLLGATCEMEAFDMSPDMPAFYAAPFLREGSRYAASRIYVCLENDRESLSAALALNKAALEHGSQVIVCMSHSSGLSKLIKSEGATGGICVFETLEAVSRPESLLGGTREILAMAIHEDYRQSQQNAGFTPETNPSMALWETLPESLKESNRHSVDATLVKLSAIGCCIELLTDAASAGFQFMPDEVERMSVIEHERWVEERTLQGWKYAPAKDIDKKLSPYLVPWEKLSEEIREYDRNVVRGTPRFLVKAGFQVHRIKKGEKASVIEKMKPMVT
jgi:preprotein translocase subunit Sss1